MNFTLTIQAPGLEKALENLAMALQGHNVSLSSTVVQETQHKQTVQQTLPQAQSLQQQTQQSVPPVAVPTSTSMQLSNQQVSQQPPISQQAVPTTPTTYTMEQLAVASSQLMDMGKRNELLQLLSMFGVQTLTALPQEQYGTYAMKLRELGVNI